MSRIEMNATELTDTDVNFVSLVKRGANRIPFRILKGDDDMLDLSQFGRRLFQKAEAVPTVIAIITQKGDVTTKSRLSALANSVGIDTAKVTKSDGVVTLCKADADLPNSVVIKLDRDYAVAISNTNLTKAFANHDFSEGLFKDADGRKGFFVGPSAATRMFNGYSAELVKSATDPCELAAQLSKAADDYKAYVTALSIGMPIPAMRADQLVKGWNDEDEDDDDDAGGTDDDGSDSSGSGDKDNTKKAETFGRELFAEGDGAARKADAGKNGTGAGFSLGDGAYETASATTDDADNTEVNGKPGARVSGTNSGLPAGATAPTKKGETVDVTSKEITGESQAGEGAAQAVDHRDDSSADDKANAGGKIAGKVKGQTLDMNGIPTKLKAPTAKNEGDAEIGKKGAGNTEDDDLSGAGAQQKDVQTLKSERAIMQMIQALAKSVQDSNAAVTKSVSELAQRVDTVATLARKTDAALNGTVFNEAGEDRVSARKSERTDIPLLDTAFSRRRA